MIPAGVAVADPPTCHGQSATIVGTPGGPGVAGTPGNDVIVTNGAASAQGGDGDDVICVTGGTRQVDAGLGNDDVDASANTVDTTVDLGGGGDTYVGSDQRDDVDADDSVNSNGAPGHDTVSTGAGNDTVLVGNGTGDVVEGDEISLGAGRDLVGTGSDFSSYQVGVGFAGEIDGGPGRDRAQLASDAESTVSADVGAGVTEDGVITTRLVGMEDLDLSVENPIPVTVIGSAAPNHLRAFVAKAHITIRSEQGDDDVYCLAVFDGSCRVSGGQGDDSLRSAGGADTVLAGPGRDVIYADGGDDSVRGGTGPDTVYAGQGNDHVRGGPGQDLLQGKKGSDYLVGGRGRDTILGGQGRDMCRGEVENACER
jgi:Ca2+-binding RTX toxin-like protein